MKFRHHGSVKKLEHLSVTLCLSFFSLLFLIGQSYGQDVDQTVHNFRDRLNNNPIQWSGNLQADLRFNTIAGVARRRDPFNLNLFGQLNFDILGINAPLSVAISDGNTTYNLPSYSFVGLSPSYKWAKLHLFRRNMTFSDYTLSGHGFNGVGVELAPGKFRLMAMYGTLRKARLEDYGYRQELDPFYQRKGYALKAGYQGDRDQIFATLFKATDDEQSLVIPDSVGATPQENLVVSLEGKKRLSTILSFEGEYAYSILTTDLGFPDRRTFGFEKTLTSLFRFNTTSKASTAYNFGVAFSPVKTWALSLYYERVNPNFTSLGTLQFRNDFENIAIGYRGKVAEIISLNGRFGLERNNLDNQEIENRNRFIGSLQLNIPVNKQWQNTLSFSNFRQTTRLIDNSNAFEPVDSIYLGSINKQFGASSSLLFAGKHRFMLNASHQRANSIIQDQIAKATSKVNNIGFNYRYAPNENRLSAGVNLFWNGLIQANVQTSAWSPSVQLNYRAGELFTISLTGTNNFTRINQVSNGSILRLVLGGQYLLAKKHRMSVRLQYIDRSGAVANNFTEVTGQIGYAMSF